MYAILDTETTDLTPGQIGQLSYILLDQDKEVTGAKNFFFRVRRMSPGAERVHGFSKTRLEHLSGGKTFSDHADEIYSDLNGTTLVIHNVPFDTKFLHAEFRTTPHSYRADKTFCTMKYFTPICGLTRRGGGAKRPKVSEVLDHCSIDIQQAHRYATQLYQSNEIDFHDARFDTAAVLAMVPYIKSEI